MIDSSSLQTWPVGLLTCVGSNMTFHGFTERWQDRGLSPGLLACGWEETAAKDLGKETDLGEVGWALTWSLSSFWICVDLVSFQLLSFSKGTIALELIGFLKNKKYIYNWTWSEVYRVPFLCEMRKPPLPMYLSVFSSTTIQKHQFFSAQPSLGSNSHIHTWLLEKPLLWQYSPQEHGVFNFL